MNYLLRVYNFLIGLQMIILIILIYFQVFLIVIFLSLILFFTAFFSREIREKIQFKFTNIGKKRTSYNYVIVSIVLTLIAFGSMIAASIAAFSKP